MIDNKKKTNTALVFINNSILKVIKKKNQCKCPQCLSCQSLQRKLKLFYNKVSVH